MLNNINLAQIKQMASEIANLLDANEENSSTRGNNQIEASIWNKFVGQGDTQEVQIGNGKKSLINEAISLEDAKKSISTYLLMKGVDSVSKALAKIGINWTANSSVNNTETDNRFTPLLNYKREEFYQTHKTIELATAKGMYTYEIFSVYSVDATKFYYIDTVFESQTEYDNFLSSLVKKSRYGTDVEVSAADSILTLSTCDYSIKNGRFVVHAKLEKTP